MKFNHNLRIGFPIAILTLFQFECLSVEAGSITFNNEQVDLTGQGFGTILQILTVQAQGNNTTEFGSVTRSGGSDVTTDDATPLSQTISVADLATKGIVSAATFGLVFNINEDNDSDVVLHDFSMTFTDDTGTPLFADISYTAPVGGDTLGVVAHGQGGSGWLFHVNLTGLEESTLFGTSTNRIGMYITSGNAIEMVSDGADEFHAIFIPEPAALALGLMGVMAAVGWRRRENKALS